MFGGEDTAEKIPSHLKTPNFQIIIVIIMENKNFKWLLSEIQKDQHFMTALHEFEVEFLVKIYKIGQLTSSIVEELYNAMQKKFYLNRKMANEEYWYENQLRIFVWLLFAYLHTTRKHIFSFSQEDWRFFSSIFNFKSLVFFQFQARSLMKLHGKPASWEQRQTQLLETIIKEKNLKNRWNSTARELFVRSNKQFFRNPKQCRERWMNHLDPAKIRSQWSVSQDLVLLNCIKKKGKRWSIAVKELDNTRTEHMVKNRYKSLILNQAKKYPGKRQADIETLLIKKLTKMQDKQVKQSPKTVQLEAKAEGWSNFINPIKFSIEQDEDLAVKQQQMSEVKEQVKIQAEMQGSGYFDKLGNHLSEFQVSSSMFIPWNLQLFDNCFTNDGKLKIHEHYYSLEFQQVQLSEQQ